MDIEEVGLTLLRGKSVALQPIVMDNVQCYPTSLGAARIFTEMLMTNTFHSIGYLVHHEGRAIGMAAVYNPNPDPREVYMEITLDEKLPMRSPLWSDVLNTLLGLAFSVINVRTVRTVYPELDEEARALLEGEGFSSGVRLMRHCSIHTVYCIDKDVWEN